MATSSKYVKLPIPIEASQWFQLGDHIAVTHYVENNSLDCKRCGRAMSVHGGIDTLEDMHVVCPTDWILGPVAAGEYWAVKDEVFKKTYVISPDGTQH